MPPETTRLSGWSRTDVPAVDRVALTAVLLALSSLAPVWLADRSALWGDERNVVRIVDRFTASELLNTLSSVHPNLPTWYLLPELAGWPATAAVSALALPVTVYAVDRAGRVLYGRPHSLVAASMVASSPFLAAQAGWLRMYAPLTAFMALGLWWGLEGHHGRAAAVLVGAAALHPFGWFGPVWLSGLWARERPRAAAAVLAAGSLPLTYLLAVKGLTVAGQSSAVTITSGAPTHTIAPAAAHAVLMAVLPLAGVVGPGLLVLPAVYVMLPLLAWPGDRRLWWWIALPVVGIPLASHLLTPVFTPKYFGFVAPGVALLAADPDKPRLQRAVVVAVLGLLMAINWAALSQGAFVARRLWLW